MRLRRLAALLALSLGAASIQLFAQGLPSAKPEDKQQPMSVTVPGPQGPGAQAATEKVRQAALQSGAALTIEKARAAISSKTNMTFGADYIAPPMKRYDSAMRLIAELPARPVLGSGTQVEYIEANGKSYLWYPANPHVVIGQWTIKENPFRLAIQEGYAIFDLVNLCFFYSAPTRAEPGAVRGTSCFPAYEYLKRVRESADGDIFGLSRRSAPPFVLDRDQTTLDALRKKAGRN